MAEASATTKYPPLLANFIPGSWFFVVIKPVFVA
jgi:hypothetical protein